MFIRISNTEDTKDVFVSAIVKKYADAFYKIVINF